MWNASTLNVKNASNRLKTSPYKISVVYKLSDNDKHVVLYLRAWAEENFFFQPMIFGPDLFLFGRESDKTERALLRDGTS